MDPRVVEHFDGDLTLANLSPRKRDKLLAKYPPPAKPTAAEIAAAEQAEADAAALLAATRSWPPAAPGCGYTYEVEVGNEFEGFAAGTAWADIPRDWCCPDCGVREASDFVPVEKVDAS